MYRPQMSYKLRELRLVSNLSVEEVADKLNKLGVKVSPKTLYSWEAGRALPPADTFLHLCDIYHVIDIMKTFGYEQTNEYEAVLLKAGQLNAEGVAALSSVIDGLLTNEAYVADKPKKHVNPA